MSTYTEDHLVEQPAIQLMQHELGWEGRNIERRTPNIEHRREENSKRRTSPALLHLNPDLPMEAIEGAVEEEILSVGFLILNGRGRDCSVFSSISPDGEMARFTENSSKFHENSGFMEP